jgi:hypothetical protein
MVRELAPLAAYGSVYSSWLQILTVARVSCERRSDADKRIGPRRAICLMFRLATRERNALSHLQKHQGRAMIDSLCAFAQ